MFTSSDVLKIHNEIQVDESINYCRESIVKIQYMINDMKNKKEFILTKILLSEYNSEIVNLEYSIKHLSNAINLIELLKKTSDEQLSVIKEYETLH